VDIAVENSTVDELVVGLLHLGSIALAKWLLPVVTGGRIILTPSNAPARAWSLSPFTSLPSGQTGVDADFAGVAGLVLLPVIVVMVIALCCWLA